MRVLGWMVLASVISASTALADPPATARPTAARPTTAPPASRSRAADPDPPPPLTRAPSVAPFLVFDPPAPPVKSLRLEALRVAGERSESDWRYPEPGPIFGYQKGSWFMGNDYYRPRTARSAALHGGSMASTLLGEILLDSGAPVAGVGALLTGATLDAAAADVDRDAEARRPLPR